MLAKNDSFSRQTAAFRELGSKLEATKADLGNYLRIKGSFSLLNPPAAVIIPLLPPRKEMEQKALSVSSEYSSAKELKAETENQIDHYTLRQLTQLHSSMFVSNSLNMSELDWEKDKNNFYYGLAIGWRVPIFNKGDKKRQRKQAEITLEKARAELEAVPEKISRHLEALYASYGEITDDIKSCKDALSSAEKEFSFSKIKYNNGDLSENDFNSKEIEFNKMKLDLTIKEYDALTIRIEIDLLCANSIAWLTGKSLF